MMSRRRFVVTGLSAASLAGCDGFGERHTLRYRLKIVVLVDGRTYEGSSVIQLRWTNSGPLAGFDNIDKFGRSARGEAVVVDLEERDPLFGLLQVPSASDLHGFWATGSPERILVPLLPPEQRTFKATQSGAVFEHLKDLEGEFDVPEAEWPILVRFLDISDPKSAVLVDPKDFAATYGPRASLKRVTIAVTRDPITRGIEEQLPWWDDVKGALIPPTGTSFAPGLSARLTKRNFKLEGDE